MDWFECQHESLATCPACNASGRYTLTHYYAWRNNEKRATMYKRQCRIVARLAQNSAIVEFENGQRECVSRNALRRIK